MTNCYVKGYVKNDGTKVKGYWRTQGPCNEKPKLIPPLSKGTLSKYGYSNIRKMSAGDRHDALKKAINAYTKNNKVSKREASLTIFRKLNAIATLKKNTLPKDSLLHKRDSRWVKKEYF